MPDRCFRCGREITNKKSVEAGYGPICAKKIKEMRESVQEDSKPTIVEQELAAESRWKILSQVSNVNDHRKNCSCGTPIIKGVLASYDHEGGMEVPGYEKKQWVYMHCPKCKYDLAVWKIGITSVDPEAPKVEVMEGEMVEEGNRPESL
jgi:hypothetical protein